jgi:hypothetical protein
VEIYFSPGMASGYILHLGMTQFWMTRGVWGPSFKRIKLIILLPLGVFFWCLWMQSWAIGGLLLATLSLGGYLLLSTMLGTVFRVHSMLPNMEINEKE